MSQENLEIVRAHIEAFRAKDTERSASFLDRAVVWDLSRVGTLEPVMHGIDAVIRQVEDHRGTFEGYDYVVDLTDLGSGQVLAAGGESGRGKGSGAPVERSFAVLYSLLGEKIVRITVFANLPDALEALGLSESGG
jgi:ketosteroid isomerase-like protein